MLKIHIGDNKLTARVGYGASIHAIFQLMVRQIQMFFPNPKGNHPSKFHVAGVRRFGGVREQTHRLTHSLIDRLVL